jgi:hypothetical protein
MSAGINSTKSLGRQIQGSAQSRGQAQIKIQKYHVIKNAQKYERDPSVNKVSGLLRDKNGVILPSTLQNNGQRNG